MAKDNGRPPVGEDGTETGDPAKPYLGKNGPRRTPPPGHPDRNKKRSKIKQDNIVRGLFGQTAVDQAEESLPKGLRPLQETKRVQTRRKKQRMGERWTAELDKMAAEGITMEEFVKHLSPEELARGQLKDKNGGFSGHPPQWVPSAFYKACIKELLSRGRTLYQENYIAAIQAMTMIATTPSVDVGQRIKAAQFVIERIEGKVPEKLEIGIAEPWQEMLVGIVAEVPDGVPVRKFEEPQGDPDGD